jgi:hypothetical protein
VHRKYIGLRLNEIQTINYNRTEVRILKKKILFSKLLSQVFGLLSINNKFIETESSCNKNAVFLTIYWKINH